MTKKSMKKKEETFNLILLGDPGAGKATQGKRLVKKYPFLREFDLGKWIRALKDPKLREMFWMDSIVRHGGLSPARAVIAKLREVIFSTPKDKGVFFNGNPKKVSEAKAVRRAFQEAGRSAPFVVYLDISEAEMIERLKNRREKIGGKVVVRGDDSARALKNRMRYYQKDIRNTVAYFKKVYWFKKISGVGSEAEVFRRLVHAIEDGRKVGRKQ